MSHVPSQSDKANLAICHNKIPFFNFYRHAMTMSPSHSIRLLPRLRGLLLGLKAGLLALALLWGGGPALAQDQATQVSTATTLRATPALNGRAIMQLPVGTALQRLEQKGGWAQVRTQSGQAGWVRAAHLPAAPGTAQGNSGGGGNIVTGLAGLFTGASSTPTATTGTRGIERHDLSQSTPDPAAVEQLERHAVSPAQAQQFARSGQLQARPIAKE